MKILSWLNYAKKKLKNSGTPELDAYLLLTFVLNLTKEKIFCLPEKIINKYHLTLLDFYLQKRVIGIPMAYILKKKNFGLYLSKLHMMF